MMQLSIKQCVYCGMLAPGLMSVELTTDRSCFFFNAKEIGYIYVRPSTTGNSTYKGQEVI